VLLEAPVLKAPAGRLAVAYRRHTAALAHLAPACRTADSPLTHPPVDPPVESHLCSRWNADAEPDPDGQQLRHVQEYLLAHEEIQYVWYDYWSMFQDERTAEQRKPTSQETDSRTEVEREEFKSMLATVNLLFLGCRTLILLDRSYMSRFWTQFEAWLAMRHCSESGLVDAHDTLQAFGGLDEFVHIDVLYDDQGYAEDLIQVMRKTWYHCSVDDAIEILSQPDVSVTNQRDKVEQLKHVRKLNDYVRKQFLSGHHAAPIGAIFDRLKEVGQLGRAKLKQLQENLQRTSEADAEPSASMRSASARSVWTLLKQAPQRQNESTAAARRAGAVATEVPPTSLSHTATSVPRGSQLGHTSVVKFSATAQVALPPQPADVDAADAATSLDADRMPPLEMRTASSLVSPASAAAHGPQAAQPSISQADAVEVAGACTKAPTVAQIAELEPGAEEASMAKTVSVVPAAEDTHSAVDEPGNISTEADVMKRISISISELSARFFHDDKERLKGLNPDEVLTV